MLARASVLHREDRLQVRRGARITPRTPGELAGRIDLDHPSPSLDRLAEPLLLVQQHPLIVQRADMRGIETQDAPECSRRIGALAHCQQRLPECEQRVEVVRIPAEQCDQQVEGLRLVSRCTAKGRQLERRLGVRRDGVERRVQLVFGFAQVAFPAQ
jgi:hypothetical protein